MLSKAYFDSNYDIRSVLEALFNSDFFRSESCWYEKVKSPAELVTGVLRLTGEFQEPRHDIMERSGAMGVMGQALTNPPSVEGWHQGTEWVDTGTLMERLNFGSEQLGNTSNSGVKAMIGRIMAARGGTVSPERLVEGCLEQMGEISVSDETRASLLEFASKGGDLDVSAAGPESSERRVAEMLQLVAATHEFQRS